MIQSFFKRIYWWSLFPLKYTSRNAEETTEFKNQNKKCSQGSEKTAPNILFKKLNIIYKSLFHKQLFLLYISTWKSFYKGDNFSTCRNTSKDGFYPISMILLSRHWGNAQSCSPDNLGASRSAVFDSSQVNPLAGPDEYPGGVGCIPGQPRPCDWGRHRRDENRESASWTSVKNEGSYWLRYRTSCLSLSHFSLSPPLLSISYLNFTIELQFYESIGASGVRSLVMLWVNNLVRKLKSEIKKVAGQGGSCL